jgi:hypothetical protein
MTRTIWLSFADADRGFLGVVVVDVTEAQAAHTIPTLAAKFPNAGEGAAWIAAAIQASHRSGANPGGEVATLDVTDVIPAEDLAKLPRNALLRRPDLERLQLI